MSDTSQGHSQSQGSGQSQGQGQNQSFETEWSKGVESAIDAFLVIYQKHFIEPDRVTENDLWTLWDASQYLDRSIYRGFSLMAVRFRKERKQNKQTQQTHELTLDDLGL